MKTPDTTIPAAAGPNQIEINTGNRIDTVVAYNAAYMPTMPAHELFTREQMWERLKDLTKENLELRKCAQALLDVYNAEELSPHYHDEAEIAEKILSDTKKDN
jgi:hypothetical protein